MNDNNCALMYLMHMAVRGGVRGEWEGPGGVGQGGQRPGEFQANHVWCPRPFQKQPTLTVKISRIQRFTIFDLRDSLGFI